MTYCALRQVFVKAIKVFSGFKSHVSLTLEDHPLKYGHMTLEL